MGVERSVAHRGPPRWRAFLPGRGDGAPGWLSNTAHGATWARVPVRAKAAAAAACLPAHLLAELTVRVALGSMLLFMFPRTVHHEHALRDIAARFTHREFRCFALLALFACFAPGR